MPLNSFDLCYHLDDNPSRVKRHDLLTSTLESCEAWLKKEYKGRSVVVHFIIPAPPKRFTTKTCGYCRQSREEEIIEPREPPPYHWKEENWSKLQ